MTTNTDAEMPDEVKKISTIAQKMENPLKKLMSPAKKTSEPVKGIDIFWT